MNLKNQRNLPAANPTEVEGNAPKDRELMIGSQVEKEHTQDIQLATKIALDHLREDPHYYSKLMAAGLVDEPEAQEMVAQSGNTAPHVETKPLAPATALSGNSSSRRPTAPADLPTPATSPSR